jgi:hypothetical protein
MRFSCSLLCTCRLAIFPHQPKTMLTTAHFPSSISLCLPLTHFRSRLSLSLALPFSPALTHTQTLVLLFAQFLICFQAKRKTCSDSHTHISHFRYRFPVCLHTFASSRHTHTNPLHRLSFLLIFHFSRPLSAAVPKVPHKNADVPLST